MINTSVGFQLQFQHYFFVPVPFVRTYYWIPFCNMYFRFSDTFHSSDSSE